MPLIPIGLLWLAGAFGTGAVVGGVTGANAAAGTQKVADRTIPWLVAGALAFYIYSRKV